MADAGQRCVRIAHGSTVKQCPIHRLFRAIVITEIHDAYHRLAYHRLAPPLLNRFEKQQHSDLPSFAERLGAGKSAWCDGMGAQMMVMAYSPIRGKIATELQKVVDIIPLEASLHELDSSQDIEKVVNEFYREAPASSGNKRFLIIHTDPAVASFRMPGCPVACIWLVMLARAGKA